MTGFVFCHFMHGVLHAARRAMGGIAVSPVEVDSIVAQVAPDAVDFVLEPLTDKQAPRTDYDAKFSLPFSVAAMLADGDVGLATYAPDRLDDPRLLAIAARVRYEVKPYGDAFAGGVRVELADGRRLEADSDCHEAGGSHVMSEGEVVHKFRSNAATALEARDREQLEADLLHLETVRSVVEMLTPLRRAGTGQPAVS